MNVVKLGFLFALLGATIYVAGKIVSEIEKEISEEVRG